MDLNKTRADVERHKAELLERLQQIPSEIKKLSEEQDQAKRQLIGIEQILEGFSLMENDNIPVLESFGLTDSVRQILSETAIHLVPTQIRDALLAKGVTGSSSKVLLINVHKTLERIEDELDKTMTPEGKTAYKRTEPWTGYIGVLNPLGNLLPRIARPGFANLPAIGPVAPPQKTGHPPALPLRRRRLRRMGELAVAREENKVKE